MHSLKMEMLHSLTYSKRKELAHEAHDASCEMQFDPDPFSWEGLWSFPTRLVRFRASFSCPDCCQATYSTYGSRPSLGQSQNLEPPVNSSQFVSDALSDLILALKLPIRYVAYCTPYFVLRGR